MSKKASVKIISVLLTTLMTLSLLSGPLTAAAGQIGGYSAAGFAASEYQINENDRENTDGKATVSGQIANMGGQPVIAEIQLHSGKAYSPYSYSTLRTYPTDAEGKFTFEVPAPYSNGFRLIVLRGSEYAYVEIPFDVNAGFNTTINVNIARIIEDLTVADGTGGWYAGDGHQHSTRSDGRDPVEQVALQNIASGNAWGMLSDHRHLNGVPEFIQRTSNYPVDFAGNDGHFLPVQGYEWTSGQPSGHMNVFGPGSEKLLSSDFPGLTGEARHAEHARRILEFQGAGSFVQANHPTNPTLKFMHESDGSVDYMRA